MSNGVVLAEEGEITMALVLVQLIDIPTLDDYLLRRMFNAVDRSSEEGDNSAMSSAFKHSLLVFVIMHQPCH